MQSGLGPQGPWNPRCAKQGTQDRAIRVGVLKGWGGKGEGSGRDTVLDRNTSHHENLVLCHACKCSSQ